MDYLRTIVDWQKVNLIAGVIIFVGVVGLGWFGYLIFRWLKHDVFGKWHNRDVYLAVLVVGMMTLSGCVTCFWLPWDFPGPSCFPE